jgi:hypothetical protein
MEINELAGEYRDTQTTKGSHTPPNRHYGSHTGRQQGDLISLKEYGVGQADGKT